MAGSSISADWRDQAAYAPLESADRALLCWEWLRRDPGYRRVAQATALSLASANEWHLHRFLQPELAVPNACPMWRSPAYALVVSAEAKFGEGDGEENKLLARLLSSAEIVTDADGQHLAICDGHHLIRLDVSGDVLAAGPTNLSFRLGGLGQFAATVATLTRLDRFVHGLPIPREPGSPLKTTRHILALRAWDGLYSGANQRDLAFELFGRDAAKSGWRSSSPSLRLRAQRLAQAARALAAGGYWSLLR